MIVLGMPAHQLDLERLFQFIISCSLDDRLTASNVIQKAEESGEHVGLMQKLLLHLGLIQRLKMATLELQNRMGYALERIFCRPGAGAAWIHSIRTKRFSSTGRWTSFHTTN